MGRRVHSLTVDVVGIVLAMDDESGVRSLINSSYFMVWYGMVWYGMVSNNIRFGNFSIYTLFEPATNENHKVKRYHLFVVLIRGLSNHRHLAAHIAHARNRHCYTVRLD